MISCVCRTLAAARKGNESQETSPNAGWGTFPLADTGVPYGRWRMVIAVAEELITEVWFRNPELYVREMVELRVGDIIWDMGYLIKKRIDPQKWIDLYYPQDIPFTMLVVGDKNQGTLELRRGDSLEKPFAKHETWQYGDDWAFLEAAMENPSGDSDPRVVATNLPAMNTQMGRAFLRRLKDLQAEYPDVKLHVHGLYAWRLMFALPFSAVDIDPRTDAKKGKILLPTGRDVQYEHAGQHQYWVNMLGFKTTDLPVPRNRCMFNIRSAQWAGRHFRANVKMKSRGDTVVDPDAWNHKPSETLSIRTKSMSAQPGDKFLCDTCSLQNTCKYYRAGAVCSVPDSEPSSLTRFFKTREADTIIEGLGSVLATQAQRLQEGRESEMDFGELDPEVTKIVNSLMSGGIKLAKLLDPRLAAAGAPRNLTQVNIGAGGQTPQALMAGIIAELEAQGYRRDQITPELIERVLENANGDTKRKAIEVAATDRDG